MMQKLNTEIEIASQQGTSSLADLDEILKYASRSSKHRGVLKNLIQELGSLQGESAFTAILHIAFASLTAKDIVQEITEILTQPKFDAFYVKVLQFIAQVGFESDCAKSCIERHFQSREAAVLITVYKALTSKSHKPNKTWIEPFIKSLLYLKSASDFIIASNFWIKLTEEMSSDQICSILPKWISTELQTATLKLLSMVDKPLCLKVCEHLGFGKEELYNRAAASEEMLEIVTSLADLEAFRATLQLQRPIILQSRDSLKSQVVKLQLALKLDQRPLPIVNLIDACEDPELEGLVEDTLAFLSIEQPEVFNNDILLKYVITKGKSPFSVVNIILNLILSEETRLFFKNDHGFTEEDSAKVREFMQSTGSINSKLLKFRAQADCVQVLQRLCEEPNLSEFLNRIMSLKVADSTAALQQRLALTLFILSELKSVRPHLVAKGCLQLLNSLDKAEAVLKGQAIARILITTDPRVLTTHLCTSLVIPMLQAISESKHQLTDFECALALTNLTSYHSEVRDLVLSKKGWNICQEMIFSENETLRLEGLNLSCNLTGSELMYTEDFRRSIYKDLKVFIALFTSGILQTQIAACSVLANLSFDSSYKEFLKSQEQLVLVLDSTLDGELAQRASILRRNLGLEIVPK